MTRSTRASWQRTHTCGELRKSNVGDSVTLNGWVDARRNHGGIYFIDLRDRYGKTQITLSEDQTEGVHISPEDVLSVTGVVVARDEQNINPDRDTGEIDLRVQTVEKLSGSLVPPFEIIPDLDTAVELRLRHRYLDLRRPDMTSKLAHRSRFIGAMRQAFLERGFLDIETPILTKATPEGARDYLVPSRVHPGKFYALPQSPQIFKQILMVAGQDRYFQVARCFRDEDLRADRQPEFTQLDMEMSFVEEEGVFEVWEGVMRETFRAAMDVELPTPFPRLTYAEAMARYGSDKPDTRFGMELFDAGAWAAESEFVVFKGTVESGGAVLGITLEGGAELSRKEITALEEVAKTYGAKGLAWWKADPAGGSGPLARFCADDRGASLCELSGAGAGDLCLFIADKRGLAQRVLGELRVHLGRTRGLAREGWNFLWVTHFPMFEYDEEAGRWTSSHHPFTAPQDWELAGDPAEMDSRAYDMVLNGWELGSGSVRIHRADVQEQVFSLLGIEEQERQQKFGFLLEALAYGAPPHAGFAMGIDRIVALTLGLDSIRDVVAFPKTTSATDIMCEAPSAVPGEQLDEVHVRSTAPADKLTE